MTTKRVLITGASGYVGSCIASYLIQQGLDVVEMNHSAVKPNQIRYALGDDLSPEVFTGIDALVHCAYDFNAAEWTDIKRLNVDGTLKLFAAARAGGVKQIIFMSTLSAFEGAVSMYGKAKLMVEQQSPDVMIVRPGLVYEQGKPRGMVGALSGLIEKVSIIPLIGTGKQILYPCHRDDLASLIYLLMSTPNAPVGVPIPAASSDGMTFRQILETIAQARSKRIQFIPVPSALIFYILKTLEVLHFRSRLRSDSLLSLNNQNPSVDFTPLQRLNISFRGFEI